MNLETCIQVLIKVNKYAESEFFIFEILYMSNCCCFQNKYTNLVKNKNDPRDKLANVIIGKQVY